MRVGFLMVAKVWGIFVCVGGGWGGGSQGAGGGLWG